MASNSETGHAKNVANCEKMITFCTSYGALYQPTNERIQLPNMQQLLQEARESMVQVTESLTAYNIAKNARKEAFEELPDLSTRVLSALAVSDVSDKTLKDARGMVRKIKGIRVSKKEKASTAAAPVATLDASADLPDEMASATETESTTATENGNGRKRQRSSSQTSFDQRIEHMARFLSLLRNEPGYKPNEPELQVSTLEQYLETMRQTNSEMIRREVELSNARLRRDRLLYAPKTGIYDVALDVKLYLKAAFGAKSSQYKQVSGLKFTKQR